MADAAKVKRFRLHVVKELYETEKDYTRNLKFTVTVCCMLKCSALEINTVSRNLCYYTT